MRGSDRPELSLQHGELVTTALLSVWTDPDTAMEAVGTSLGIFGERVADARSILATESPLRHALFAVLLSLVEGGALEKRACSDGRYAFRWRDDIASAGASPDTDTARLEACLASLRGPATVAASPATVAASPAAGAASPEPGRQWLRLAAATAPLVLPAVSCLIALLAFVLFDLPVALVIAGALTLVGVIGLVRRVPFAGLWTMGVVVAGLLLRLS